MKRVKKEFWRGLSGVLAFLLIFITFVSPIADTYARRINAMLGISTSEVVSSGSSTEDTAYFKSDYGTDIYDLEQLAQLEADAAAEEVRQVEAGVVLLKNDNDALPLAEGSSVTLFGQSTVNPFYSYHSVSNSMQTLVTYVDSMRSVYDVNETLVSAYSSSGYTRVRSATSPVIGEAPAEFYTDALKQSWQTSYNDAAIVFITRQGGEDSDLVMETSEGISQLALHQDERDMLAMLQQEKANGVFDKIIVLVNANSAMELGWLEEYDVDACLWVGTPGIVGFTGVANVLTGEVSPSGHLVDTYAKNSLSAPAYVNAGQNSYTWANLDEVTAYCSDDAKYVSYYITYAEGIYVGYKYFETRYEDAILNQGGAISSVGSSTGMAWNYTDEVSYPFGYGLSYTTFEQKLTGVTYNADTDMYTVSVAVTNTGDVAGKSVVQVYAQTPYGEYEKTYNVEKAAVNLVGYSKTAELAPGETAMIDVEVERYLLASYDYTNAKGYILSAGDYYLAIGDDAHDAVNNILAAKNATGMVDVLGNPASGDAAKTYTWNQAELDTTSYRYSEETGAEVTNQFEEADLNYWIDGAVTYLSRKDWAGTYPAPMAIVATEAMMKELDNQNYVKPADAKSISDFAQGVDAGLTFVDMRNVEYDDPLWETFLDQLTLEQMTSILPDQNGAAEITEIGLPASYRGDDMDCLEQVTFKANGKSGIVWPSAVLLATTWDVDCVARRAAFTGNEAYFMRCTEIWSGGPNFHRNQFCGRNNAYYSEDATMDYIIGRVMSLNCQKYGVILGYKHLVLNDQELYRESIATFCNEQALREIYMRAFEGAYVDGDCLGVMTAFNRVGCTYGGSCASVLNDVMRGEWGFRGVVCSDAVVGMNYKTHYVENLVAGMDYWCWDMAGFGPPPGGFGGGGAAPGGAASGEPSGEASGEASAGAASGEAAAPAAEPAAAAADTAETADTGNSGTYDAGGLSSEVIYNAIVENDDGYLYECLRTAVKNQLYAESRTNLINGLSADSVVVTVTPWWRTALTALNIALGVLTAGSIGMYAWAVVSECKRRKESN